MADRHNAADPAAGRHRLAPPPRSCRWQTGPRDCNRPMSPASRETPSSPARGPGNPPGILGRRPPRAPTHRSAACHERQVSGHLEQLLALQSQVGGPRARLEAVLEACALIQYGLRDAHATELALHRHTSDPSSRHSGGCRSSCGSSSARARRPESCGTTSPPMSSQSTACTPWRQRPVHPPNPLCGGSLQRHPVPILRSAWRRRKRSTDGTSETAPERTRRVCTAGPRRPIRHFAVDPAVGLRPIRSPRRDS